MKISYSFIPTAKGINMVICDTAEISKPSSPSEDAQFLIHNGVLYPVRPEVIQ